MKIARRLNHIDVVMSEPPGPTSEFIEVEDDQGHSMGESSGITWVRDRAGNWRLRIPPQAYGINTALRDTVTGLLLALTVIAVLWLVTR